VLWIGLRRLHLEESLLVGLGLNEWMEVGQRPAFDPFGAFPGDPAGLATFLTVRFLGLVLIVPVIEEFFLRGFVMRWVVQDPWWKVPFGEVTRAAALAAVAYAVASHPGEWIAAAAWFSLVTWLMHRTRSIGECVTAHATTNLLLGVYVVLWREWWLW
jgi:CAAX prenyl protease-like protein